MINKYLLLIIPICIALYLCFYKIETFAEPKIDTKSVYNSDGSTTDYPKKYECYFDQKKYYPELSLINKNRNIILEELTKVKDSDPKLWHEWIQGQLSVIPLYFFGKWSSKGKQLFPKTSEIIKDIKDIRTVAFSRLKPNSQIQPHIGWGDLANDILRCHYGVNVPKDCGCVCDNWVVLHKNDEWLVFDDAKMHSSYNFSNEDRIIIIIDMKRPENIPKGKSKVAYKKEVLDFIHGFYDKSDIDDIRKNLDI
jgi:hypothetical protein